MSARLYLDEVVSLLERLGTEQYDAITSAGNEVATVIESGGKIWVTNTAHGIADEVTKRAGGFIAVHELFDIPIVQRGDCVLIGSPVGTSRHTIEFALGAKERGAFTIGLTNIAFEMAPTTIIEHPSGSRLHEIADLVIDIGGPLGDGVFEVPELALRAIPHSGVTLVAGLWMIFTHALETLRDRNVIARLYQCVMVDGARSRNAVQIEGYLRSGVGYLSADEAERVVAGG